MRCEICKSGHRAAVEAHIRPLTIRELARHYGLSEWAIYRHRRNHMAPARLSDPAPVLNPAPAPEPPRRQTLTEWEQGYLEGLGYSPAAIAEMDRAEGVRLIGQGRKQAQPEPAPWDEETPEEKVANRKREIACAY